MSTSTDLKEKEFVAESNNMNVKKGYPPQLAARGSNPGSLNGTPPQTLRIDTNSSVKSSPSSSPSDTHNLLPASMETQPTGFNHAVPRFQSYHNIIVSLATFYNQFHQSAKQSPQSTAPASSHPPSANGKPITSTSPISLIKTRNENPTDFNGCCELLSELINDSLLDNELKDYFQDSKHGQMDDTLCQSLYELASNVKFVGNGAESSPSIVALAVLQMVPLLVYTLISRQSQTPPIPAPGVAAVLLAITKSEIQEISEERTLQVCEIALHRYVEKISYMSLSSHHIFCVLARLLVDRNDNKNGVDAIIQSTSSVNSATRSVSSPLQLQAFSSWSHTYILSNELISELVHALTYCSTNPLTMKVATTALHHIHCRAIEDLLPDVLLQTTVLLEKRI